jgi:hypothetical protein
MRGRIARNETHLMSQGAADLLWAGISIVQRTMSDAFCVSKMHMPRRQIRKIGAAWPRLMSDFYGRKSGKKA